jgi:phenylacetate-CoA ligase
MMQADPLDRRNVEQAQLPLLRHLLDALIPANPFYAPRLAAAGITPGVADLETFRQRCPLTDKSELADDQRAHPPYGTNLTYPIEQYTRFNQTSGTTAAPMRWLDTIESWQALLDCWKQVYEAAGVRDDDRLYFAFSFGPFLGFWTAFEAATQLGRLCIPGGGLTSLARLHMILDNRATILCCTPTYAMRLAEVAQQHDLKLTDAAVRTIIVAGEGGGSIPAVRKRLGDLWNGARVFDHHGMTEVGPVTYEDPHRPGVLRVIESSYLAEVINPDSGQPVAHGRVGELVLTTLTRLGSPLLRYRTGDLVKPIYVADDNMPGDHLAFEGGILGRCDDMLLVRGVNVYPSAIDQLLRAHAGLAEYRVQVDHHGTLTELAITVEPQPGVDVEGLRRAIVSDLRQAMNLRIDVHTAAPGELPRFEMKARRWIRKS